MDRLLAAITRKCRAAIAEWAARREGARHLPRDIFTAARHIVGPTGYAFSGAWQRLDEDGAKYLRSFDPRIPPSVFLSPSDLTRSVHPVPLAERCIEDWDQPPGNQDESSR
ncbi:MAG: hypothetical protein OXK16_02705 [bacterium]|nr:hypothetical protein [bacterium]